MIQNRMETLNGGERTFEVPITGVALVSKPGVFHQNPDQFAGGFARAWYTLTHRNMGPITRISACWFPRSRCFGKTRSPTSLMN